MRSALANRKRKFFSYYMYVYLEANQTEPGNRKQLNSEASQRTTVAYCIHACRAMYVLHACTSSHRRHFWGFRVSRPPDFGMGGSWLVGRGCGGLHEILSCPITYRNVRWEHFPKWWILRNRKICIKINKNSWDDTLNLVLCASVCWHFRTHDTPSFKTMTHDYLIIQTRTNDTPRSQTRLTPMFR